MSTSMLSALAEVTPAVEDAVQTWREAIAARDEAWDAYVIEMTANNQRRTREHRRVRRGAAFVRAERRYAQLDHAATWARDEIEAALRIANPTADGRSIMATLREVTR